MSRSRVLFLALSLVVVGPLVAGALAVATSRDEPAEDDSFFKHLSVFTDVLGLVQQAYVEERQMDALMAGALEGSTDALDPFAVYVPAGAVELFTAAREAAGVLSGLTVLKERGVVFVAAVETGSPAAAAEIERGDLLSRIEGVSTRELPIWEVWEHLAGTAGAVRHLELVRLGEARTVEMTLADFPRPLITYEVEGGFPRLRIERFQAGTAAAVETALARAAQEGAGSLVVDLRGVAGGKIEVGFEVAALFRDGELGALRERDRVVQTFSSERPARWSGEVAVAVDSGTQGAAEVLAAALQGAEGLRIVGVPTFGQAGRSELVVLSSGAALYLATGFYAGAGGDLLDHALTPDVLVDERSRRLSDQDRPIDDLILERCWEVLRGDEAEETEEAEAAA